MQDLRITLFQPELLWEDPIGNLARFDEKLRDYRGMQDLILLPEMFNTGFSVEPESIAEPPGGPTMLWLSRKAKELNCVISGTLIIREGVNFYNRLVWMRPDGNVDTYDKRHLFRMAGEHLQFRGGNRKHIVELNGWRICPLVCYDLRFPVWVNNRHMALAGIFCELSKDEARIFPLSVMHICDGPRKLSNLEHRGVQDG